MKYNYYILYDCFMNTVDFTMSRVDPFSIFPTWEIRGNDGNIIGNLNVNLIFFNIL